MADLYLKFKIFMWCNQGMHDGQVQLLQSLFYLKSIMYLMIKSLLILYVVFSLFSTNDKPKLSPIFVARMLDEISTGKLGGLVKEFQNLNLASGKHAREMYTPLNPTFINKNCGWQGYI